MGIFKGPNITTRADKISSFTVATAEYGSPVLEILGTTRISGNVLYYDDFTAHEHRETHRTGKGGGGKQTTITYSYTVAVIIGLCEGEVKNIGKVWIDKSVYTYPHSDIQLTLFKGTANQAPWGYVTSKHPEKALSYPNLAYMAGVIDLGSNGSMPNFNFEVLGKLTETGDGKDVNPADYIKYVLDKVGLNGIEIVGLDNYRAYCKAADLLISTPSDSTEARTAREIVNEIAELTNAYMFWSNDAFKIVPREDRQVGSWKPNKTILYDLTPDDFLPQSGGACVTYSRKDSSELYNRFSVEFLNRENGYEKETVSYEDTADIALYGVKQASTINAHYVYTKARAVMLAEAAARKNKYERNKYTFVLGWAFCRLEPGDLVTLTDPSLGLERVPVIIDSVVEGTDGKLTFTAISRPPADYGEAEFDVHENERPYIDFNFDPGSISTPSIFQPDTSLMYGDNEVWIGAYGENQYWGGCNVWASNNNTGYKLIGTINQGARIGYLVKDMSETDTELEVSINSQLVSGTLEDAEKGNTLLWMNGESMSYTTATLLENGNFLLSGIIRGQYNTTPIKHYAKTQITRCDDALIRCNFLYSDIGQQIYFKFTSFNVLMGNEQSLADVPYYTRIIQKRDARPPDVTALECTRLSTGTRQFWWTFKYPTPNDVEGFELRYNQGSNVTWDTGIPLHTGLITEQPFETEALRQGVHTIMIKAVDNTGNYSKGVASVIANLGDPLEENVLYKANASENAWSNCTHTGATNAEGNLMSSSDSYYWPDSNTPMWTKADALHWSESYKYFELSFQVFAPASGQMWLKYDIEGPCEIEYRLVGKDGYWMDEKTPFWGGNESWASWVDSKEMLKPYTGKSMVNAGDTIQLFIKAPNNVSEPTVIKELTLIIDVPDRQEHFEDITVPLSGLLLPIATPNYYTTAVRIDAVQNSNIAVARAAVINRNPCMIKLVDINGQPVSATVDVTWQGFVKEVI